MLLLGSGGKENVKAGQDQIFKILICSRQKLGKIIAKLTSPDQDRVSAAQSLFGILPQDADLGASREERLAMK